MAFENSQAFTLETKKLVDTHQFESVSRLEVQADKPIKKIMFIKALPKIISTEKIGEYVEFNGRTSYQVVYETEEGVLASVVAAVDFQNKLEVAYENVSLKVSIDENEITGFSAGEVAISSLVKVDVYAVVSEKISSVKELTDDYVSEEKTYEYQRIVNTVNETFNEVAEHEINTKLDDILFYTSDVKLTNAIAGIDTITIEGEVNVNITAIEDGQVKNIVKQVEIKQEMASLSVIPTNMVDATLNVSDLKVTASVSDIDQKTNLIIALELNADAVIYARDNITVVEDAFSVKKEIISNGECVASTLFDGDKVYSDTVTGGFETAREVDLLCFVNSYEVAIAERTANGLSSTITGAINVETICETEAREKVRVDGIIPFALVVEGLNDSDNLTVNARLTSAKLRGQKEIECVFEVIAYYKKQSTNYITFLSSIEEVEDKAQTESAIKVYVVKEGEDLFSVAKAISVRPIDIVDQNPIIANGLNAGARLIVYSPLDINF